MEFVDRSNYLLSRYTLLSIGTLILLLVQYFIENALKLGSDLLLQWESFVGLDKQIFIVHLLHNELQSSIRRQLLTDILKRVGQVDLKLHELVLEKIHEVCALVNPLNTQRRHHYTSPDRVAQMRCDSAFQECEELSRSRVDVNICLIKHLPSKLHNNRI